MKKIAITTECICDLTKEFLAEYDIDLVYFDIRTEEGLFSDTEEINALNVIEYINSGKRAKSSAPSANVYKKFFEEKLKEYDEVIHLCISSRISKAYENAGIGTAKMGMDAGKIFVVDSRSISASLGMLAIRAAMARDRGLDTKEILEMLEEEIPNTYTTLITKNADYLYLSGQVTERVRRLCRVFNFHPVLIMKDGVFELRSLGTGNYKKCYTRFLKRELKNAENADRSMGFVCYAGCSKDMREELTEIAEEKHVFEKMFYPIVGATICVNSGPESFSVQFMHKSAKRK